MAGCSSSPVHSSLPVCTYRNPGPVTTTKNGSAYTTLAPLCKPPTPVLRRPVALGTTVDLSYGLPPDPGSASGRFTVYKVWDGVTPLLENLQLFSHGETPARELERFTNGKTVQWIGIDLAITNTSSPNSLSEGVIGLGGAGGPNAPVLYFLVNGLGVLPSVGTFVDSVFVVGVPGCPFVFPTNGFFTPGATIQGCAAVPVPVGVKVSTVGFDLQLVSGAAVEHVAKWTVG
jgi:hypothetical protein